MSAQEVTVQNLVKINSAVINLRMREQTRFHVDFFLLTLPSIQLFTNPVFRRGYRSYFGTILTHDGSNGASLVVPIGL